MLTDTPTFSFNFLSPAFIIDSLETLNIRVDSGLTALNSYENRVYQFVDDNRKRYVVKFYRPQRWNQLQILEEHQFSQQLLAANLPVAAPIEFNNQTLHQHQGAFFAVFPSVGGYQYEIDNLYHMESIGETLSKIHQIGSHKPFKNRPTLGFEEYLYQPHEILSTSSLVPQSLRSELTSSLTKLITVTENHWHNDWQKIRLHSDCHAGNILWRDNALLVDFDDSRNGPAIQDLWMLLQGNRQEQQQQLSLLIDVYQEHFTFNSDELYLIEPLRAMRMVYHLAWIINRWSDPAFPIAFPWIPESDFWSQQLTLFNQQIEAIKSPPLELMMGM